MGELRQVEPVLLLAAAFSRHAAALDWARERLASAWGPVALESAHFEFEETDYYRPTMGAGIRKCFWAFEPMLDPAELAQRKLEANAWEAEYTGLGRHAEPRPLNLDPGYLTSAKLVLASTKDHAHRLYLARGIYAEVTLFYKDRRWQHRDWTFPDYRRQDYQAFFSAMPRIICAPGRRRRADDLARRRRGDAQLFDLARGRLCHAALAPQIGLVDLPGPRKVHARATPLGGGLAIWLGLVGAFVLGQLALDAWTPALGSAPDGARSETAAGDERVAAGPEAALEQSVDELRRLVRLHAAGLHEKAGDLWMLLAAATGVMLLGLADDLVGDRLAPALGGAGGPGLRAGSGKSLATDDVHRCSAAHGNLERRVDRRPDQLVQHARQHGRPLGRRGDDRGRAARGHLAHGAESGHPGSAALRGRFFARAGRRAGRIPVAQSAARAALHGGRRQLPGRILPGRGHAAGHVYGRKFAPPRHPGAVVRAGRAAL